MKRIKTIIVDDEPAPLKRLQKLLQEDEEIDLIGICKNGQEATVNIAEKQPDLVFLDIQMPGMDGFEVLENIDKAKAPVIVFVTAYDEYALQAFEVHAIDYLLKPFDKKRFAVALERAKEYVRYAADVGMEARVEQLLKHHRASRGSLSRLMIKTSDKIFFLKVEDVDWLEAAGNYVRIHTNDKSYLLRETMSNMEEKLPSENFFRIHRSFIVNIDRIRELESWFHGDYMVILENGKKLNMSRNYKQLLQQFN